MLELKWEIILLSSLLVLDGMVSFPWTDCSEFSFLFLENETVSAGNYTDFPAKRQRAEMDSHEATELGYLLPVRAHESKEGGNEGP